MPFLRMALCRIESCSATPRPHTWLGITPPALCRILLLAGLLGTYLACSGSSATLHPVSRTDDPILLLISIDGFRWDFMDLHDAPNLSALADRGVRSRGLIPVFPTLTFPNHYTAVTGLYPVEHGIVSNRFYDPVLDRSFTYSNSEDAADSTWWGGEPIWVTVRRHGMRAATYFWVGSETVVDGMRPDYWFPYDGSVPGPDRVDQVLRWLDLPDDERPSFISLYFSEVDGAAHRHGPESVETRDAVRSVDSHIGRLIDGLRAQDLLERVNIIIVSDHGMATTDPKSVIYLEDYIDVESVRFSERGPTATMWPLDASVPDLYRRLDGAHPHLFVYTRDTLPSRWHYEGSPRIPPLIALADEGWSFGRRIDENAGRRTGGAHGYDPSLKSMHGLFVAHGPAFKQASEIPELEIIHLYALMADILGVEPAPNSGSLSATSATRAAVHEPELSPDK